MSYFSLEKMTEKNENIYNKFQKSKAQFGFWTILFDQLYKL